MALISQNQKLEFNEIFEKNMLSIKKINSTLYQQLQEVSPNTSRLIQDKANNTNIEMNGTLLYQDDPELVAQLQIKAFLKQPQVIESRVAFDQDYCPTNCQNLNQLHIDMLQHQYHYIKEEEKISTPTPAQIPLIFIAGTGLGYHIKPLCKKARNIVVYEPNLEVFFLSLFTTNYNEIIEEMTKPMRSIIFAVGKTPEQCLQAVYDRHNNMSNHLLVNTHLFVHYNSPQLKQDIQTILNLWHRVHTVSGFSEDEFYSINHWASTLEKKPRLIHKQHPTEKINTPVLIIGSGPSVNKQFDIIKKIREKIIIISCSSSLFSCYKNGIKPDFHVEMERNEAMLNVLNNFEDKSFLKSISLLSIHTVHPDIATYFKENTVAFKKIDLSFTVFNQITNLQIHGVEFCYPTAGNAGLGFATALGFTTIYAVGLDFGYHDPNHHHAQDSQHEALTRIYPVQRMEHQLTVESVDGKTIGTSVLLDNARFYAERLAQKNPEIKYINLSQGAKITGFTHLTLEESLFSQTPCMNKNHVYIALLQNTSTFAELEFDVNFLSASMKKHWRRHIRKTELIVKSLQKFMTLPQSSVELSFDWLDMVSYELQKAIDDYPVQKILLGGTIATLQTLTAVTLLKIKQGDAMQARMTLLLKIWQLHLYAILEVFKSNYKQPCNKIDIEKYKIPAQKLMNEYRPKTF